MRCEPDDADLVVRARAGDAEAFGVLLRRYLRGAHVVARAVVGDPADADDVVQEAFLQALRQLEQCRDPSRFAAWLYAIVRTRGLNWLRAVRRRRSESLEVVADLAGGADPRDLMEQREVRRRLEEGMTRLDPSDREVLLLTDLEGWSHADVAELLGLSQTGSRQRLHRARQRLRAILLEKRRSSDE